MLMVSKSPPKGETCENGDMRGGQSMGRNPNTQYDWENDDYPNRY